MRQNERFTVALIGASGLLGRAVATELASAPSTQTWRVVHTAHRRADAASVKLDLLDHDAVRAFVRDLAPDAIVVAAAERRPDICENDPALARALNVEALSVVATEARALGTWVLSISTDYVFDGASPPYLPDDAPAPLNAYGQSKLDGERALLASDPMSCVLRLPLLYGPFTDWSESAVTSLTPAIVKSSEAAGAPASMDAWATRYPTYTPDVAVVIRGMLEHHAKGATISGITQWSGDEPMTKFDIAERIARALKVDAKLVAQRTPADATPRPRDCHLDSGRLEALGIGRRTPFDIAIGRLLAKYPDVSSQ
ncbi:MULTISPECIES: dTDP-4-dehydrorhamnose reductase family protein [Caballeronia]|uniref:dTDP-4-dehydrorhamnose reductase family protein n=1 Tax=Caballeronia TaxID=1827195 RepID=UPI0015894C06|nr:MULTISPECIES: SDR family oxidoreductase [Caballeronia]MCG7403589.1 SDR family oxidoreductase [Caballeronia zhejiangensis]MCI1045499.1 SDR family oxidoreductase [Caballeronia zhejiangensis]